MPPAGRGNIGQYLLQCASRSMLCYVCIGGSNVTLSSQHFAFYIYLYTYPCLTSQHRRALIVYAVVHAPQSSQWLLKIPALYEVTLGLLSLHLHTCQLWSGKLLAAHVHRLRALMCQLTATTMTCSHRPPSHRGLAPKLSCRAVRCQVVSNWCI